MKRIGIISLLWCICITLSARTIYVARHGQVGDKKCYDTVVHERTLTPTGREQAQLLAGYLRGKCHFEGTILVSPLYRTIETSMPIAKLLGKKVILEPGIQEMNRGPKAVGMTFEQIEERFPGMTVKGPAFTEPWRIANEPDEARLERSREALKRILAENPGDLLLVSHGAIVGDIKKIMNEKLPKGKQASGMVWNCSLWIYELDDNDQVKSARGTTEFMPDEKVTNNNHPGKLESKKQKQKKK